MTHLNWKHKPMFLKTTILWGRRGRLISNEDSTIFLAISLNSMQYYDIFFMSMVPVPFLKHPQLLWGCCEPMLLFLNQIYIYSDSNYSLLKYLEGTPWQCSVKNCRKQLATLEDLQRWGYCKLWLNQKCIL